MFLTPNKFPSPESRGKCRGIQRSLERGGHRQHSDHARMGILRGRLDGRLHAHEGHIGEFLTQKQILFFGFTRLTEKSFFTNDIGHISFRRSF